MGFGWDADPYDEIDTFEEIDYAYSEQVSVDDVYQLFIQSRKDALRLINWLGNPNFSYFVRRFMDETNDPFLLLTDEDCDKLIERVDVSISNLQCLMTDGIDIFDPMNKDRVSDLFLDVYKVSIIIKRLFNSRLKMFANPQSEN
jgi:hypothetical protein